MIAERIKERRRVLNLTGAQLAEIAYVSQPYISAIERGIKEPSRAVLFALAKALKTSVTYLIGETNNPDALALLRKKQSVVTVFLDVSAQTAWERISREGELPPFLKNEAPEDSQSPYQIHNALHERRAGAYRQLASVTIKAEGKSPADIAREIFEEWTRVKAHQKGVS